MGKNDVLLVGVAAIAAILLFGRKSDDAPMTYTPPETEDERWTKPPVIIDDPGLVYQNPFTLNIPMQALIAQAVGVQKWQDIPTAEKFGIYSVDKGTYIEYYATM